VIEQQNKTMFYATDMTEQEARDWAFNPDWKPCPIYGVRATGAYCICSMYG